MKEVLKGVIFGFALVIAVNETLNYFDLNPWPIHEIRERIEHQDRMLKYKDTTISLYKEQIEIYQRERDMILKALSNSQRDTLYKLEGIKYDTIIRYKTDTHLVRPDYTPYIKLMLNGKCNTPPQGSQIKPFAK